MLRLLSVRVWGLFFLIPIDCRYVNGNLYLMKRQLGCCIPVRGGLWVSASIILYLAYSRKHESQTSNPQLHSLSFICIRIVYMSLIFLQRLGSGRRRILGTTDSRSGWCCIRRKSIHKRAIFEAEKFQLHLGPWFCLVVVVFWQRCVHSTTASCDSILV